MSMGHAAKNAVETAIRQLGKTIQVYNDSGTDGLPSLEVRGLQNTEKGKGSFRFAERQNVENGSIVRVKGSKDLWKVIDTEDSIHDDVYVSFYVHVEKVDSRGNQIYVNNEGRLVINAPVQGGIQVGGSHNVQNVSITVNPKFDEAVSSLLKLIISDATLDKYQKEDAVDALKKLPDLAKEEQTESVIKRAKDKLEVIKSVISISKDLAAMAAPYLPVIAQHFHLFS